MKRIVSLIASATEIACALGFEDELVGRSHECDFPAGIERLPALTARILKPLYLFLLNKWYFDELYDWLFVRPAFWIGRMLWKGGDGKVIDGLGPDGIAAATAKL